MLEDDIYVEISDLNIQQKEVYGEERSEIIIDIFQGIFTQSEADKDIKTYIKILKNNIKILGKRNRVEMDSQEFEKYFDIYSENNN